MKKERVAYSRVANININTNLKSWFFFSIDKNGNTLNHSWVFGNLIGDKQNMEAVLSNKIWYKLEDFLR